MPEQITPEMLLNAYAAGVFPMSESRNDPALFWLDPRQRGIFDLDRFHISRSLGRKIRNEPYKIRADTAFSTVVQGCAARPETWINAPLYALYLKLNAMGYAHSIEVWEGDVLVGGVFGLTLGSAFFGESMFSRRRDTSKIALAYLVDRLKIGGFTLFDTQFLTSHLASLGAIEISRGAYRKRLADALNHTAYFNSAGPIPSGYLILQRNNQTS